MIYITGDCHGDWKKFSSKNFPISDKENEKNYVIVCGDFGLWHDTNEERYWLKWLEEKNFILLFVDGNHENFNRLYSEEFPIVDFCNGRAKQIRKNIFYLMRGEIYIIENKKFFCFGGASSHDIQDGIIDPFDFKNNVEFRKTVEEWTKQNKMFRINHYSWWKEELPSDKELVYGLENLQKHNFEVDYIISHCCPFSLEKEFLCVGDHKPDILTNYFDTIRINTNFQTWFFGHYHDNRILSLENKNFVMLYDYIIDLDKI